MPLVTREWKVQRIFRLLYMLFFFSFSPSARIIWWCEITKREQIQCLNFRAPQHRASQVKINKSILCIKKSSRKLKRSEQKCVATTTTTTAFLRNFPRCFTDGWKENCCIYDFLAPYFTLAYTLNASLENIAKLWSSGDYASNRRRRRSVGRVFLLYVFLFIYSFHLSCKDAKDALYALLKKEKKKCRSNYAQGRMIMCTHENFLRPWEERYLWFFFFCLNSSRKVFRERHFSSCCFFFSMPLFLFVGLEKG